MRARLIFLVVAILAVAGFAAQNWPEFTRSTPLNFGVVQSPAPLGLILLSLLGLTLLVFLISSATSRTQNLMESRQHTKDLQAQRDLADKAEVSRFTDLRQMLDTHLRDEKQRETIASTELEKTMVQHQRDTRAQIDQISHMLASRLGEMESRLETRLQRMDSSSTQHQPVRTEPVQGVASRPQAHPAVLPTDASRL